MLIKERDIEDLADALARGRVALSELAVIPRQELDALFEFAAERLDAERFDEASEIFSLVVTLFPFEPRYWRGLGIALQNGERFAAAATAYDAALALDPDDPYATCYRGEMALYLGDVPCAQQLLNSALENSPPEVANRAQDLLEKLVATTPEPPAPLQPFAEEVTFTLADQTPLPLVGGRFDTQRDEPTQTGAESLWLDATSPGTAAENRDEAPEVTARVHRGEAGERTGRRWVRRGGLVSLEGEHGTYVVTSVRRAALGALSKRLHSANLLGDNDEL